MMAIHSKNTLSAALAAGVFLAGTAPALAASSKKSHNHHNHHRANLVLSAQRDVDQLVRRAYYVNKKLGILAALSITREGSTDVVTRIEGAPTQTGSDKGGEYDITFVADASPSGIPDLDRVQKIEISEGSPAAHGELTDGTMLEAQITPGNARIAEVNYPFNVPRPVVSEAAAHPVPDEAGLRANWLVHWDKLASRIIAGAAQQTPTGPYLPQLWHQPAGTQVIPF